MRRLGLIAIALASCILLFKGCGLLLFPSAELHYKLAVDVDVDGVIHHGEGVYWVSFQSQGPLLIGNTPQWSIGVSGEAFPIDLGERGTIFVLMLPDWFRESPPNRPGRRYAEFTTAEAGRQALWSYFDFTVNDLHNGRESQAKIEAFANSNTTVDMPPTALPLLVRFGDIDNPETIERVDPADLTKTFGSNVKIVRATASITHQKRTCCIDEYLKWDKSIGSRADNQKLPIGHLLRINSDAFERGISE